MIQLAYKFMTASCVNFGLFVVAAAFFFCRCFSRPPAFSTFSWPSAFSSPSSSSSSEEEEDKFATSIFSNCFSTFLLNSLRNAETVCLFFIDCCLSKVSSFGDNNPTTAKGDFNGVFAFLPPLCCLLLLLLLFVIGVFSPS